MTDKEAATPASAWALPMGVGVLFLLYGLGMFLMGDDDSAPLVLLAALLGAASLGWGYWKKSQT